jgi:hypothetical protein
MNIPSTGLGDDEQLVVSPRRARHMLDCGNTRLYELLKNNELESYLDGRSRKIIAASIHRYIAQRLKKSESRAAFAPIAAASRRGRPGKVRSGGNAAP